MEEEVKYDRSRKADLRQKNLDVFCTNVEHKEIQDNLGSIKHISGASPTSRKSKGKRKRKWKLTSLKKTSGSIGILPPLKDRSELLSKEYLEKEIEIFRGIQKSATDSKLSGYGASSDKKETGTECDGDKEASLFTDEGDTKEIPSVKSPRKGDDGRFSKGQDVSEDVRSSRQGPLDDVKLSARHGPEDAGSSARKERFSRSPDKSRSSSRHDQDKEHQKHPKPLKLCVFITKHPVLSFLIACSGHIAALVTTAVLMATGHDVFPLVFDDLPLLLFNDPRLRSLAWKSKDVHEKAVFRPVYGASAYPTWYQGRIKDTVEVQYESPGQNVLRKEVFMAISRAENYLFNNNEYSQATSSYCVIDINDNCVKPQSLFRLFDGSYIHVDTIFFDLNFTNIPQVLYMASQYNETKEFLELFIGTDAIITNQTAYSSITRSFFLMGWPLEERGIADLKDFLVNNFKWAIEDGVKHGILGTWTDVYYLSKIMYETELVAQALKDLMLAIGSVLFIFVFMCFQTGSVSITSLGILSILSSFVLTNLIYRYVFRYIYFGFFHVIIIFLILGIGADDLFVFYDTWRLTGHTKYPSDAHRLSDCYRRAAKTTFVTSATTMVAFLVSGLSPLLPVQSFGIFAGVLVGINYISVIVFFPTIIILHHAKIKGTWSKFHSCLLKFCVTDDVGKDPLTMTFDRRSIGPGYDTEVDSNTTPSPFTSSTNLIVKNKNNTDLHSEIRDSYSINSSRHYCTCNKEIEGPLDTKIVMEEKTSLNSARNATGQETYPDYETKPWFFCLPIGTSSKIENSKESCEICGKVKAKDFKRRMSTQHDATSTEKPRKDFENRNKVVLFLKNGFFDFVTKRPVKIGVPLLFLGISIFFIHRATLLEPDTHQLRLWREHHNYAKATARHYFQFKRNFGEETNTVHIVWGLKPADVSDCDLKSAEYCKGEPVWDESFDVSSAKSQLALKALCERLLGLSDEELNELRIRRNSLTGQPEIACFVPAMERFLHIEENWRYWNYRKYPSDMSLKLPVTKGNITMLMNENYYIYRADLPQEFDRYFELLISFWLSDRYMSEATADYIQFSHLLGEILIDDVSQEAWGSGSELYYGTKLRYMAIRINTTMNVYTLGYEEGLPLYYKWDDFVQRQMDQMPPNLQGAFQTTETLWHWLFVQETLSHSATTGLLIGLLTAWPILILTTLNYIIGTLAVIIIGLVTACVVGMIPLAGWKLGVLESINLCMVVGLSVDYIVHMAEAYRMSSASRRMQRVHDMLESIGLSVLSGAVTTVGAAIFMLFAQITFFFQFGIFIISTIGTALIFSLLGFTTFMALCGPQGNAGSLVNLFACLSGVFARFCGCTVKKKGEEPAGCYCCRSRCTLGKWCCCRESETTCAVDAQTESVEVAQSNRSKQTA